MAHKRKSEIQTARLVRLPHGGRRVWCACGELGVTVWPGPLCNGGGVRSPGGIAYDCGVCGRSTLLEFVRPLPSDRGGVRWHRAIMWLRDETPEETAARRARKNIVWNWSEFTEEVRYEHVTTEVGV